MRRVAITGMGIVSPIGSGIERFWANLVAGRSGIGAITLFDASTFPVRIGGEVDDLDIASVVERADALLPCFLWGYSCILPTLLELFPPVMFRPFPIPGYQL